MQNNTCLPIEKLEDPALREIMQLSQRLNQLKINQANILNSLKNFLLIQSESKEIDFELFNQTLQGACFSLSVLANFCLELTMLYQTNKLKPQQINEKNQPLDDWAWFVNTMKKLIDWRPNHKKNYLIEPEIFRLINHLNARQNNFLIYLENDSSLIQLKNSLINNDKIDHATEILNITTMFDRKTITNLLNNKKLDGCQILVRSITANHACGLFIYHGCYFCFLPNANNKNADMLHVTDNLSAAIEILLTELTHHNKEFFDLNIYAYSLLPNKNFFSTSEINSLLEENYNNYKNLLDFNTHYLQLIEANRANDETSYNFWLEKWQKDLSIDCAPWNEANLLSYACAVNYKNIEKLFTLGANLNFTDQSGRSYLHDAVMFNKIKTAKTLISCGIDVNIQDVLGQTPLMLAIENQNIFLVKILLKAGANPLIQNNINQNAFVIARKMHQFQIYKIIKNFNKENTNNISNLVNPLSFFQKNTQKRDQLNISSLPIKKRKIKGENIAEPKKNEIAISNFNF